jgi:CheY-like chemotaxis protein
VSVAARASILVVEDDEAMRAVLAEELGDAGYLVRAAAGAAEGLELAKGERFDLVITDLRMPEMDGFDLIRGVMDLAEPPNVVMITAFGSIETAIRAVKLGAYDYITKPFEIEELLLCTAKALEERRLRRKVARLQREVEERFAIGNLIAKSQAMRDVAAMVHRVAGSTASVLITGESGTGKELVSRAIHYASPRKDNPFVAVNLAAVPESLIESELFGHKKGAFTDARSDKPGLFEQLVRRVVIDLAAHVGMVTAAVLAVASRVMAAMSFVTVTCGGRVITVFSVFTVRGRSGVLLSLRDAAVVQLPPGVELVQLREQRQEQERQYDHAADEELRGAAHGHAPASTGEVLDDREEHRTQPQRQHDDEAVQPREAEAIGLHQETHRCDQKADRRQQRRELPRVGPDVAVGDEVLLLTTAMFRGTHVTTPRPD